MRRAPYRRIQHLLGALKSVRRMKPAPKPMVTYAATALAKEVRDLLGDDVDDGVWAREPD